MTMTWEQIHIWVTQLDIPAVYTIHLHNVSHRLMSDGVSPPLVWLDDGLVWFVFPQASVVFLLDVFDNAHYTRVPLLAECHTDGTTRRFEASSYWDDDIFNRICQEAA